MDRIRPIYEQDDEAPVATHAGSDGGVEFIRAIRRRHLRPVTSSEDPLALEGPHRRTCRWCCRAEHLLASGGVHDGVQVARAT